jgi:hypothetical protein
MTERDQVLTLIRRELGPVLLAAGPEDQAKALAETVADAAYLGEQFNPWGLAGVITAVVLAALTYRETYGRPVRPDPLLSRIIDAMKSDPKPEGPTDGP